MTGYTARGTIPAIPTQFNGIQFRSRLEARWAAFFEILDWNYVYEPLDANGYIPDFLITHPDSIGLPPLLIEVKPAVTHADYMAAATKTNDGLAGHWDHGVLIVGASPYYENPSNATAGLYIHKGIPAAASWWMRGSESHNALVYIKPSFVRGGHVRGIQTHVKTLDKWWRKAGNEVQWKSPGAAKPPMSTAEQTQARIRRAQEKKHG